MKGRELVKIIQDRNLEDFDIEFTFVDGYCESGINVRTFNIEELCDIGYSSNKVSFEGDEI
ncbi:hypothetical protein MCG45_16180 [Clostridium perfringens]|uniref:hypothetical protein n=1 Tax=Clostridium perfringens TaxID=1502 RepID=UPI001F05B0A2|nr:hypothetical protein [Clostridium perfringens]MCH1964368.1 hypothetical protein [Clostridium perfringens]